MTAPPVGPDSIDLSEPRQTTTITIPRTQHKLVRDLAYDWGCTQAGLIGAAIAVASQYPEQWLAVLQEAKRSASELAE